MGVKENLELVRKGYAAFVAGDMDTLRTLLRADAVHSVPGSSPIAGDFKGADQMLGLYADLFARSGATLKIDLESVMSNGSTQVIAVHTSNAQREGRSITQREALLFTIDNGKISSIQDFFSDIDEQDAFWA